MKTEIFAEITAAIAAKLETGVRPWSKPWSDSHAGGEMPRNAKGRPYRGANAFWLMLIGQSRGYASPVWMTFNQAKDMGGNVAKGEKGTVVFFWKFGEYEDKKTGEKRNSCMVRTYTVFNVAQCEGIKIAAPQPLPEIERVEAAESMMAQTGAVIQYGGARAFYSPTIDRVQIPPRESFKSADGFYSTVFHELGHWTGHESRLARTYGARFGDDAYAFEELVAELTAAFVCGSQGFASLDRADHAEYLATWSRVLRNDPKAFITAASAAQKAADMIIQGQAAQAEAEPEGEAIAA